MNQPKHVMDAIYISETKDWVKRIETHFFILGKRLHRIKEEKLWMNGYDSYTEFLEDAKINPSLASMLTAIHQKYIVEGGMEQKTLEGIGYSNLYEAIPLIESDGITKTVTKARTLTRAEIKDEVRDEKHGEHEHKLGKERWGACEHCGKFIKID